jgi:hypothetical protein
MNISRSYNSGDTLQENEIDFETHYINYCKTHNNLDDKITGYEIKAAITYLKSNKACGCDEVINEYLKSSVHVMLLIYVKLFNIILNIGVLPEAWLLGNIF